MTPSKKLNLQVVIIVAIAISTVAIWELVQIPNFDKLSENYTLNKEYEGQNQIAENVNEELSAPFFLKDSLKQTIIDQNGDELTINSIVTSKKAETNEVLFFVENTFYVDAKTRKHLDRNGELFAFSPGVEKKDYNFFHPEVFMNDPMMFKGIENLHGVEVYLFEVESKGADISFAFPQYAPHTIHTDTVSKLWVEPTTGNVISFEKSWDNYLVENGQRINTVELGGKKTTPFTESIIVQATNAQIENIYFHNVLMPIFMLGTILASGTIWILFTYSKKMKHETMQFAEKNKLRDELVSMLSHEIKNPLTPIQMMSKILLMEKDGTLNDAQKKRIQVILQNTNVLVELLSDFSDVKRLDLDQIELSKSQVDLKEYLASVIESVRPFTGDKNISLTLDLDKTWEIVCDQKRISQVISNLVKNAIDFVPENNGKIVISANRTPEGTEISVQDNGIGIAVEDSEIIFERFKQLTNPKNVKHDGSGLGLSVCKGIIESHGGQIWLDKEFDEGSRFKFLIP